MHISSVPAAIAGALVTSVEDGPGSWVIAASGSGQGACPDCGTVSNARHSGYVRRLRDLPVQGAAVTIHLSVARLRCRNTACGRRTFVEPLPRLAARLARHTHRLADTLHRVGHSMGGRPAERLLVQLGIPVSDDTVLRLVKRRAVRTPAQTPRVLGIDDWAWAKGQRFGTIMVDLERRTVVDVLPDRSSSSTAAWLAEHPGVEIISRDRHGLYAEGARVGAPDARQVADRFHLVQTLREKIEQALARLGRPVRQGTAAAAEADERRALRRQELADSFAQVRTLYEAGRTAANIVRDLGLSRRRVDKWVKLTALPERNAMAPKPSSPAFFDAYLSRRWAEGCTMARRLYTELRQRGYTGCYTYLARYVAPWRSRPEAKEPDAGTVPALPARLPCDPVSGRRLSPQTAAALCMKPRPQLTERQAAAVDALKVAVPDFGMMRRLAMRFRGILRGYDAGKLDRWLHDAHHCGIYAMRRFARTLQSDLDAVQNAVTEPWSNGATEGQISRLKTLKRAMGGRAGCELLRARMLAAPTASLHGE